MQALRNSPWFLACMTLAVLSIATDAHTQTVFQYNLPTSWDGVSSTVTDLSAAENNATLSASPALSSTIPLGTAAGTQSLSSAGGGFQTANIDLLSNTLVEANGGYYFEVYFYWDGTATAYTTQKLIDYAGTESLHLQNINTGSGTADLLFGFNDAVEGPTQSINANTWYKVSAFFDTQGNTIDGSGNLAGLATLVVNGVAINASVTKTTQGDNLNRPIGVGTLPSGSGLVNFNGFLYNPMVALGLPTLVGHWRLDETSGITAADSSGYGNNGTYTNSPTLGVAGPYPGDISTAADFDGSSFVQIAGLLNQPTSCSLAAWVKIDQSDSGGVDAISMGDHITLRPYETSTDGVRAFFFPSSGSAVSVSYNQNYVGKGWHHFVTVFDDASDALQLYVDGVLVSTTSTTASIGWTGLGNATFLGTQGNGSNDYYMDGSIDDARIYNCPLSDIEVAELYGLVGHWKMDEGGGSTAADATAFGNDATLAGATWTTDCAGNNGLEFDGLGDTAATNSVFDPPERGTVALWIRSDGPPAVRQRPWGVGSDYEMWQDPDGFISCDVSTDGFQGGFITNEPLHMDGRWYHLIAEYDSDDDSYSIYINGELHKSGISTWAIVKQAANTLTFGTRTGNAEYFEGALRDFRIYNRPLSGSEISELSGLVGYWKLDESSGTVAVDSSANSNDGTYTGGVVLFQPGNVDQAADFDGLDDYVGVPDDPSLQMDDTFSMSMWIRADNNSSNVEGMILNKEGEYEIALTPSGELKWGITNIDPGWSWYATGHILAFGKWTHVALTYDNGTVNTYVNGVLVDTYNGSGLVGDQYPSLNELRIGGRSNNPPGKYFDGRIDDVRVFSRVMCPEEVFGQYKGGRPAGVRILKWIEVR